MKLCLSDKQFSKLLLVSQISKGINLQPNFIVITLSFNNLVTTPKFQYCQAHLLTCSQWAPMGFQALPPPQCYKSLVGLIYCSPSLDCLSKCPLILALPPAHLKKLGKAELDNCIEPLTLSLHSTLHLLSGTDSTQPAPAGQCWDGGMLPPRRVVLVGQGIQLGAGLPWERCWNVPRHQVHHLRKHQAS